MANKYSRTLRSHIRLCGRVHWKVEVNELLERFHSKHICRIDTKSIVDGVISEVEFHTWMIFYHKVLSVPQSSTTTYVHKYKITVYKSISQKIISM